MLRRLEPVKAVDWSAIIEQLVSSGLTLADVGKAMQGQVTNSMLIHYRLGVQPAHWRGELLLNYWCEQTHMDRAAAPTCDVTPRNHRVARTIRAPETFGIVGAKMLQEAFGVSKLVPPSPPMSKNGGKKGWPKGKPRKVAEAV